MPTAPLIALAAWLAAILLVAPSVPLANLLPASLGTLSLGAMAASLVLAARLRWLDALCGGPDRAYAVHRGAGIVAVAALSGHWGLASGVGAGVVPALSEFGEALGVWAGSTVMTLSVLSALRIVPYHLWRLSHRLMGPTFVIAALHTLLAAGPVPALSVPWLVLLAVSAAGIAGWLRTLAAPREAPARVTAVRRLRDAVEIEVEGDLPPYRPGQFAALTISALGDEPHPFTIAGGSGQKWRFGIADAGDWTARFVSQVRPGQEVRVGPPRGRFRPRLDAERPAQFWVAGGTGITPFLACLDRMAPDGGAPVTLLYVYREAESAIGMEHLRREAARLPQLRLVLQDATQLGRPDASALSGLLGDLPNRCDLCACGPEGLKDLARDAWTGAGKRGRVRQERFDFRGAYGPASPRAWVGLLRETGRKAGGAVARALALRYRIIP